MDTQTVVIVDDHQIFRTGLSQIIAAEPEFCVVAEGESGDDAIRLAHAHRPALMLLDVSMRPGGIQAIPDIVQASPTSQVVMLSATGEPAGVSQALAFGAAGYILKDTRRAELLTALAEIVRGEAYISPALMSGLFTYQSPSVRSERSRLDSLTSGERRVLELLAEGRSNAEIGAALAVQVKTVKFHLSNIYEKLGVRNRVEAALLGRRGAP